MGLYQIGSARCVVPFGSITNHGRDEAAVVAYRARSYPSKQRTRKVIHTTLATQAKEIPLSRREGERAYLYFLLFQLVVVSKWYV